MTLAATIGAIGVLALAGCSDVVQWERQQHADRERNEQTCHAKGGEIRKDSAGNRTCWVEGQMVAP